MLLDIVGGAALAYVLYWFHWTFRAQFEAIVTGDSYWSKYDDTSIYE